MTIESMIPNVSDPSFELSPDQTEIRDQAERFFMSELYPHQQKMDDEEWWPEDTFAKLGEMGYLGLTIPEEFGGAGLDYLTTGVICEAMAAANHAITLSWAAHDNLCANNIYRNGSDGQRRKYLPKLCSGAFIGALGMTEPGAGSDALGSMRTTARRDGSDYVLNGTKMFITNGPNADVLLVYAKTEPEKGVHGISAFIVERDYPGFKVAQKLDKMGYRGSPTGELLFDDCRVPAGNLVGRENQGNVVIMSGLDLERAMISPICVGVAARALELSVEYAKTREQFGKPIASFQMIQSKLATMFVQLESARTFAYRVLAACNQLSHGEGGRGSIHKLTAAGVHYAAEMSSRILDDAVQIHGGMGYMRETEVNRLYRAGKLMEIGGGTQEVRKIIIAGEMLKE
jgi:isovaleryl-CoA dehydrogenase